MPKDILLHLPIIDAFLNFYCVYYIKHNPVTLHAEMPIFICYTENENAAIKIKYLLENDCTNECIDYFYEHVKDKILW